MSDVTPNQSKSDSPVLKVESLTIDLPRDGDRPHAVESVSFEVNPGEVLCLVGESGSGKSVIAFGVMGLLAKALSVSKGSIQLVGEELIGIDEQRLRDLRCTEMGMIFQEPMTALNPVMRCGEQIDEVLEEHTSLSAQERRRRFLEMIEQVHLPDPERMYSSYPHQLSGGQRQRIALAHIIVKDAPILVLDEATSALDSEAEAAIQTSLKGLMQGKTVIAIAHRLSTIAHMDRILVMDAGSIVEEGTHKSLIAQNGLYAGFWKRQSGGFLDVAAE